MRRNHAIAAVLGALAIGIAPDPVISTPTWASQNFVLVDGPNAGETWSAENTPYLVPILKEIDDPSVNVVTVRKSAQVAFTTAAMAWLGKNIATMPAREMVIFPTLTSVQDFNREKLQPAIDASPQLRRLVRSQTSRSAAGSTSMSKRYRGGSLTLTGANSAADLRSKTIKRQFRDEIDEWPADLEGQGDPYGMADARLISFHASGDWKVLEGSTPTIRGQSRIDKRFEEGDQRYYQVPCPHCGEFQRLEFGDKDSAFGLKFETVFPHRAHYVCRHNGCIIEHHEKRAMVAEGRFVAEAPGPGRNPSFHLDALISNLTTWDALAAAFLAAKDDPQKLKAFVNLWLGESWEERGDAPDWQQLLMRREDYEARRIPVGGLVLTGAADIQSDGIYYELVAWGLGMESWSIDAGFIPGDTATREGLVWTRLGEIMSTHYPDAYGGGWPIDMFAVDAGYQTQIVYDWCRRRMRARPIKGQAGWYKPAIASAPSKQDLKFSGERVKKRGIMLWPVGTWPLKATLYTNLRALGIRDGEEADPPGLCHFTTAVHDETFFKQLTAEHLKDRERHGRVVREWVASGANHYHDCRIYNMAMAEHLRLSTLSTDEWRAIAAQRGVPKGDQADLFAPIAESVTPPPAAHRPQRRVRRVIRTRA